MRRLGLVLALLCALAAAIGAAPFLIVLAIAERRRRPVGLTVLGYLLRACRWLYVELIGAPHGAWHGCAQCGAPIEAPSRSEFCSPTCRRYARLARRESVAQELDGIPY